MNASVKGALSQLDKSWKCFTHKGKPMTKKEVKLVLEYAYKKGYETTNQIQDSEIEELINAQNKNKSSYEYWFRKDGTFTKKEEDSVWIKNMFFRCFALDEKSAIEKFNVYTSKIV
jgi:hypothetical protein